MVVCLSPPSPSLAFRLHAKAAQTGGEERRGEGREQAEGISTLVRWTWRKPEVGKAFFPLFVCIAVHVLPFACLNRDEVGYLSHHSRPSSSKAVQTFFSARGGSPPSLPLSPSPTTRGLFPILFSPSSPRASVTVFFLFFFLRARCSCTRDVHAVPSPCALSCRAEQKKSACVCARIGVCVYVWLPHWTAGVRILLMCAAFFFSIFSLSVCVCVWCIYVCQVRSFMFHGSIAKNGKRKVCAVCVRALLRASPSFLFSSYHL